MIHPRQFDAACAHFTARMWRVATWRDSYFGSAYATRLRAAIEDAEEALASIKQVLADADATTIGAER